MGRVIKDSLKMGKSTERASLYATMINIMKDIHGRGVNKWKDGRIYSDTWVANKMDGTGVFTWPDRKKYVGSYSGDNKHSYGVFLWPDWKKFEGCWSNGKQHGYGMFTNGDTQFGEREWVRR
jgi:hypothetical protein